jgi:AcrR family transcriptional regulator
MNDARDNWVAELHGVGQEVLYHLKTHRPRLYRYLRSRGEVKEHVLQAQEQAERYANRADEKGRPPEETWEVIRETWISLPDVDEPADTET